MIRRQASLAGNSVAVRVRTETHTMSGWRHHGEYTTCSHVLAGVLRFEFGPCG